VRYVNIFNKRFLAERFSDLKAAVGDSDGVAMSVTVGWGIAELQQRITDAVARATGRVTKRFLLPLGGPHIA